MCIRDRDFFVAFYVGLADRYDMQYLDYGMPVFHRGFRTGWWGWPRGYDAWAVPYTQSTVIIDVIDAHSNQLVWRGHDVDTLNTCLLYTSDAADERSSVDLG